MAKNFSGTFGTTIQLNNLHPEYNPVTLSGTVATSSGDGVNGQDLVWTVTNIGTVDGNQAGVRLVAGGTVTNGSASNTTAPIIGRNAEGVRIGTSAGTVTNFGTIATTATSSAAIQLDFGGKITNGSNTSTAATITATNLSAIYVSNAIGTVVNFGSIGGFFGGIRLSAGGVISNKASGLITASNQGVGIYVGAAAGTVTNLGTVSGSVGIALGAGGTITNGSTASSAAMIEATPSGYGSGVVLGSAGGTLINFASVSGFYGVEVQFGGKVTNQLGASIISSTAGGSGIRIGGGAVAITNSGTIVGTTGVSAAGTATGAVTLTNAGTITGTGGTAVQLSVGNDKVIVQAGALFNGAVLAGGGTDTLVFTQSGSISLAGFAGFETVQLASAGANTVALANANFVGVTGASIRVLGGAAGNTVDASALTGANRIVFTGGAGLDSATGGAGNDLFMFSAANLTGADTVAGGAGADQLNLTTAGTIAASGVSGVETFMLAGTGASSLVLVDANFVGVDGASIQVIDGAGGNTVDASALTGANRIVFTGAAGADSVTGGAGNDLFTFARASLSSADIVVGGGGADQLNLTTAGLIDAGGVSGVETFRLSGTGANNLTLTDANFAGVIGASIRVIGGAAGNVVNASGLTGSNKVVFIGGAGDDRIQVGPVTTMTGGAGTNRFTFDDIGANTITDFAASASNQLVLRDSGFDLGVNEGNGTASLQHLSASVFTANPTGTFTTTGQRFAYNTTTGRLFYDPDGSAASFSPNSVVVLTGHPSLAAGSLGQVFFTA